MKKLTLDKIRFWTTNAILSNIRKMQEQEKHYKKVANNEPCYIGKVARKRAEQARKNWVLLEREAEKRMLPV